MRFSERGNRVGGAALGLLGLFVVGGCEEPAAEPTFIPTPGAPEGEVTEVEGLRTYVFTDSGFDSLIYAQIFAEPGSAGHDHVLRATEYVGTIRYDLADPSLCEVEVTLSVEALQVDEDAMRDLVGYDKHLSNSQQSTVREKMLAEDQLDLASYPTMVFASTGCEADGEVVRLNGELTVHGVTRSVQLNIDPVVTTEGIYASGALEISHQDFGITPYSLLNFQNADAIKLTLSLHGAPE